jgi:hypothetical protein
LTDLLIHPERAQLEHLEDLIDDWQQKLRADLQAAADHGVPDGQYLERFLETTRQLSASLSKSLPPQLAPEAVAEIRGYLLDWLTTNYTTPDVRPLDVVDHFTVTAESIRHIIRDALDGHPGCDEEDAAVLLSVLEGWLPRIGQRDRAHLIGISERQLQRIAKDGGRATRRLQLVVRLVAVLRRGWTPEGVLAWFSRPRPELDGHAPIKVIDDPQYEQMLMVAVRQGRAQHGS